MAWPETYEALADGAGNTIYADHINSLRRIVVGPTMKNVEGHYAGDVKAAIADAANWQELYITPGTHTIATTPATLPFQPGRVIKGVGRHDQCIIQQTTNNVPVLQVTAENTHSVTLENLTLAYASAQTSAHTNGAGLRLLTTSGSGAGLYNWVLRDVEIHDAYDGIATAGTGVSVIWGSSFENVTIRRPAHSGVSFIGGTVAGGSPSLRFDSLRVYGGAAYSGPTPTGPCIRLNGCSAVFNDLATEGWSDHCLWLDGGGRCVVNNWHVESQTFDDAFGTLIYNQGYKLILNAAVVSGTNNSSSYVRMINGDTGAQTWVTGWENTMTTGTGIGFSMMTDSPGDGLYLAGVTNIGAETVSIPVAAGFVTDANVRKIVIRDYPEAVASGSRTRSRGATSVADGGTITHGCIIAPRFVRVTPSVAGEMAAVTAIGATTFTVAIKKHDNTAGTTQTVYWEAEI